jgi:hypothetical protein
LCLILCLAACQRGGQNNTEAVRQGVLDHLAKSTSNINVSAMDVKIAAVQFNGEQADATVDVTAKGQSAVPPMTLKYHLEHQNNKWVVVGRATESGHGGAVDPNAGGGANPHGGAMPPAMPGADNPHGGAMPPAGGAGKMPSPQDLPPAKKK